MEGLRVQIEVIAATFKVIFQAASKFTIAFVRLILGKIEFDGFTRPQHETYVRYEFDFKVILKRLEPK